MIYVLEVLAISALVASGIAIMLGALSPGDALRRVGAVLVLLLILPALITCFAQTTIAPMLASLRAAAKDIAYVLLAIAAIALFCWFVLYKIQRFVANDHRKIGDQ